MDEYERIAETLIAMFDAGDRANVMRELDALTRPVALVVAVMMANRMTADRREQFTGFLASVAMALSTGADDWTAVTAKTYPGA